MSANHSPFTAFVRGEQAAEKGRLLRESRDKHPTAAKAAVILPALCGDKTPASLWIEFFRSL
jgi:hypothetical protein